MKKNIYISLLFVNIFINISCKESFSDRCIREVNDINRQCPKFIDEKTCLDSIKYLEDKNTFQYFYSIEGNVDNDLKSAIDRDKIVDGISNTPGMKDYMDNQVTFEYKYYQKNSNNELICIIVTPQDYKK